MIHSPHPYVNPGLVYDRHSFLLIAALASLVF